MAWGFAQTRCGPKPALDTGKPICNGFTVVELLLTVAIILTIAAIAVPRYLSAIDQAKIAKAVADLHTIGIAAKVTKSDGSEDFLSLRFSSRWGGELRLNHQPNIAWRRGHDTKLMPPIDIQAKDVPRPFYEVDCTHHNCSLN